MSSFYLYVRGRGEKQKKCLKEEGTVAEAVFSFSFLFNTGFDILHQRKGGLTTSACPEGKIDKDSY